MSTTSAPKYENSLQTAVRWTGNVLWAAYWAYVLYRIFRWLFPARPRIDFVPHPRDIIAENAEHVRQAEIAVREFRRQQILIEELIEEDRTEHLATPQLRPMSLDEWRSRPNSQLRSQARTCMERCKRDARKHLACIEVPTKRQAAKVGMLQSVVDEHDAQEKAWWEKLEREMEEEDRANIPKLYAYLVKHGHLDSKITLAQFHKRAFPEYCPPRKWALVDGKPWDVRSGKDWLKLAAWICIPAIVIQLIAYRIIAPELFPF